MPDQPGSGTDTRGNVSRSCRGAFLFDTLCADHPENTLCVLAERGAAPGIADFSFYTQALSHFSVTDHNATSFFCVIRF
ncbi:hypothetical protein LQL31_003937 [Salmonella enterica subsp. enterica serovar Newport]|nr:hypothetical protein [Salmonella enterica]EIN2212503.1 hypothetical protein [Salmonella enterica subsp. enterica serovar Newport]EIL1872175.1 hypothetical protein [Salmonella enterica]EIO4229615.1 hypothetical protein [Salmonella enterica subsp. enterica serovar Newport]EIO4274701.1 hypothetical protein [Salmonella enterica subsp. enterica serovar Newport]